MGQYIEPAELVEESGRRIELMGTLSETEEQLREGERIATFTQRPFGKVALLIDGEGDFVAVQGDLQNLLGLYAIGPALIEQPMMDPEEINFKKGMKVLWPKKLGGEVLTVVGTISVPENERHLAGHSQFVQVRDGHGALHPHASGTHFILAPGQ